MKLAEKNFKEKRSSISSIDFISYVARIPASYN